MQKQNVMGKKWYVKDEWSLLAILQYWKHSLLKDMNIKELFSNAGIVLNGHDLDLMIIDKKMDLEHILGV